MNDDIIIITAAGASTWLRERFTPSGVVRWLGEGLVSDYAQKMDYLRQVDDRIYEWSKDLGTYIDLMESAFVSKRLVDLASYALVINSTLKKVSLEEGNIQQISEEAVKNFEKERGTGEPSFLHNVKTLWRDPTESPTLSEEEISSQMGSSAYENFNLIKEAGWWDDLSRKWVHKKLWSKKLKERDADLKGFFSKSKSIVGRVRNLCDKLHALRASGEIGQYLDTLREVSKLQKDFESDTKHGFNAIYKKHLKELVEQALQSDESDGYQSGGLPPDPHVATAVADQQVAESNLNPEDPEEAAEAVASVEVADEASRAIKSPPSPLSPAGQLQSGQPFEAVAPTTTSPSPSPSSSISSPSSTISPAEEHESSLPPLIPQGYDLNMWNKLREEILNSPHINEDDKNELKKDPQKMYKAIMALYPRKSIKSYLHQDFIQKLASCSNKYEAAHLMFKYSQHIEDTDLESSLKLLAIAEGLLDE